MHFDWRSSRWKPLWLRASAMVAGFLLRWIFAKYVGVEPYIGTPTISVEPLQAVVIEAVLTFLLVFSIFGTAIDPRAPKVGGFGIGLTVTFDILVGGPLTGAAMNPARFTGIGLAAGHLDNLWIYWVGPVVGGTLAAILYTKFLLEDKKQG